MTFEAPKPGEVLVVVGPTASGKTELAIQLAEKFSGEIVIADSVQIYAHFDIGSGKPTAEELARAQHHLVGVIDPTDAMDAARYVALADAAITDITARGKTAIVCGGTFLWTKALLRGLAGSAPRDEAVRARHRELVEMDGTAALHDRLRAVDEEAATRLAPADVLRVSRALEVFELTGKPLSDWHREHGFATVRYPSRLLGVNRERAEIDARIEARARMWLDGGWIAEVEALIARGYASTRAMSSVGYREVLAFVEGRLPREELLTAVVRSTRTFVRRQRTWLRDEPVQWLDLEPRGTVVAS